MWFCAQRRRKCCLARHGANWRSISRLGAAEECQIIEGHCCRTMCTCASRSSEVSGASVIGFLKGKSAIAMARLCGKERNFTGEHFWARGYAVSTVGFELEQVRKYIREQESADVTAAVSNSSTKAP